MTTLPMLALAFAPLAGQGITPDTLHVPDDHSTIQAAIDAASEGDVILVAPGTYLESLIDCGSIARRVEFWAVGSYAIAVTNMDLVRVSAAPSAHQPSGFVRSGTTLPRGNGPSGGASTV